MLKVNWEKSFTNKAQVIVLKRVNKSMLFTEELSKTDPNSIQTKIEMIPLNLIWVKEESSKDGTKASQPWKEVKEQLWSVLLNTLMEKEDLHQEFHQTPPYISKLSSWTSRISKRKNGKWVTNKKLPKRLKLKTKETRLSKKQTTRKLLVSTKREWISLRMNNILRLKKS